MKLKEVRKIALVIEVKDCLSYLFQVSTFPTPFRSYRIVVENKAITGFFEIDGKSHRLIKRDAISSAKAVHHFYSRMISYISKIIVNIRNIVTADVYVIFLKTGKMAYYAHQLNTFIVISFDSPVLSLNTERSKQHKNKCDNLLHII